MSLKSCHERHCEEDIVRRGNLLLAMVDPHVALLLGMTVDPHVASLLGMTLFCVVIARRSRGNYQWMDGQPCALLRRVLTDCGLL